MDPEPLFQLPDEVILSPLFKTFPCREVQIRTLGTLIYPFAAPCRNLVLHGVEATGKTAITAALLKAFADDDRDTQTTPKATINYAVVNSIECVTGRHLFEKTVAEVAQALGFDRSNPRCESLAQLTIELTRMLTNIKRHDDWRFVLVFDGIDRQRDAPYTLLPALARLSELIPCLTTIFIMTCPPPLCLREAATPHLHFPNYTKKELVSIVSTTQTPEPIARRATEAETRELWPRFCTMVHESLSRSAARTLPAFSRACHTLWPRFTAPIVAGNYSAKEFTRLFIASRMHFQDERILDPGIIKRKDDEPLVDGNGNTQSGSTSIPATPSKTGRGQQLAVTPSRTSGTPSRLLGYTPTKGPGTPKGLGTPSAAGTPGRGGFLQSHSQTTELTSLPTTARLLLLAAYLASHNQAKHDSTLFCTSFTGKKRRRGGMGGAGRRSKHRKIARKLLGAHAFVMERMLAIFLAVKSEWAPDLGVGAVDGDVGMAVATLASLRLLVKVGAAGTDVLDRGGKWRVNVGWEVVRGVGRSIGVEVEDWLID